MSQAPQWPESMTTQLAIDDRNLIGPALQIFAGLAKSWSLTELEQRALLGWPPSVYKDVLEHGDVICSLDQALRSQGAEQSRALRPEQVWGRVHR